MILNYAGIAGRSVPRPRWYLPDRAKELRVRLFPRRDTRDTNDVLESPESPPRAYMRTLFRDERGNSSFPELSSVSLAAEIAETRGNVCVSVSRNAYSRLYALVVQKHMHFLSARFIEKKIIYIMFVGIPT